MRKECDFSRGVRRDRQADRVTRHGRDGEKSGAERDAPLTRTQMQELDRRAKDSRDRTRYLLINYFSPRFALYYNVSEDTYGTNEPVHATLFKRRVAALAVKRVLGSGVEIVTCRVDGRGRLVLTSAAVQMRKRRRTRNEVARPRLNIRPPCHLLNAEEAIAALERLRKRGTWGRNLTLPSSPFVKR